MNHSHTCDRILRTLEIDSKPFRIYIYIYIYRNVNGNYNRPNKRMLIVLNDSRLHLI